MTSGHVDGDASEQATCPEGDQPLLADPLKKYQLTQRSALAPDQRAWNACLPEIGSDLGGHLGGSLDANQGELGLRQMRQGLAHWTILPRRTVREHPEVGFGTACARAEL
ncbi:hypothetical protein [Streptomyces xanthochromogenes]|uniref:hypothetical protein n=1 Tax=Streptomyces xanthochromogenes TaxID=67384 RepID=UPI003436230A